MKETFAFLSIILVLLLSSGCSTKAEDVEFPWFNVNEISVENDKYDTANISYLASDEQTVLIYTEGWLDTLHEERVSQLSIYDLSGDLRKHIELGTEMHPVAADANNNDYVVVLAGYGSSVDDDVFKIGYIDSEAGIIIGDIDITSLFEGSEDIQIADMIYDGNNCYINYFTRGAEQQYRLIGITSAGTRLYDVEYDGYNYGLGHDDNSIFLAVEDDDGSLNERQIISIDKSTGKMSSEKIGIESDKDFATIRIGDSKEELYVFDPMDGKYDVWQNGSIIKTIDFSYCDWNHYELCNSNPRYLSDSAIILEKVYELSECTSGKPCVLYILTTKDPLSRTILRAASLHGFTRLDSEAIIEFNRTSEDCYIVADNRYIEDKYDSRYLATDSMQRDISSGYGPDILIGFGETVQLNRPDMLVDLNGYIDGGSGIDRTGYFNNIFKAFETNGELYQMPLDVSIYGLRIDDQIEPDTASGKGFTVDEYIQFIRTVNADPLLVINDRVLFTNLLFNNMSGYDNETMCDILAYIKEAPRSGLSAYSRDTGIVFIKDRIDLVSSCAQGEDWKIYGFPSADGCGPAMMIFDSIGISSSSEYKDEAWDFIKICLGYDNQCRINTIPVNRTAFDHYINQEFYMYDDSDRAYPVSLSPSQALLFKDLVESIDHCIVEDSEVQVIVDEEVQGYFEGDRSADDCVRIIESRVQLLIDERN